MMMMIPYLNLTGLLTSKLMCVTTSPRRNKLMDYSHPTVIITKLLHFFSGL